MDDSNKGLSFTPYATIQTTKINTDVFKFSSPKDVSYPVAPLVSAKLYTPEGGQLTLKIRAALYMNSEILDAPVVEPPEEDIKNGVLNIYYDYDFSEETPETCNMWYIELDYISPTVKNIKKIISYMKNLDPETSRGTSTEIP